MHPWSPAFHAMTIAAQQRRAMAAAQQRRASVTRVGQNGTTLPISAPAAPAPAPPLPPLRTLVEQEKSRAILDEFREGFKAITPELIATGLVIGILSGAGSTIGAVIGTFIVQAFTGPPSSSRNRRRK